MRKKEEKGNMSRKWKGNRVKLLQKKEFTVTYRLPDEKSSFFSGEGGLSL
jgi:hypothetical protein